MDNKNSRRLIRVFLGLLVSLTVLNALTPPRTFSENENRVLAQFPQVDLRALLSGELAIRLQQWFDDQFVFRDQWIALKTISERMLGKIESNQVYFGKQRQLIAATLISDTTSMHRNGEFILNFARQVDLPVSVMIVPSAALLDQQQLPWLALNSDQTALLKQISDQLSPQVEVLEVTEALRQLREQLPPGQTLYFKSDHHWTAWGAYAGARVFLQSIGETPLQPHTEIQYRVAAQHFQGTLVSRSGAFWHAGDPIVVWDWRDPVDYSVEYDQSGVKEDSLFSWRKLDQKDKYQVYLDGNHALTEIQTEREDKERLLVIKDSYAHVMVPYLVPHFSEILMADLRYYRLPLSDLIREHQIDRILIVYSLDQFCNEANLVWLR